MVEEMMLLSGLHLQNKSWSFCHSTDRKNNVFFLFIKLKENKKGNLYSSFSSRKCVWRKLAPGRQLLSEVYHSEGHVWQRQTGVQEPQRPAGFAHHTEEGGLCVEGAAEHEPGGKDGDQGWHWIQENSVLSSGELVPSDNERVHDVKILD